MMSVSSAWREDSLTMPTEMPAQGASMGTPASKSARLAPQTEAMEEDPFDSMMSATTRTVYGKASSEGSRGLSGFLKRAPWPISRRPGPRSGLVSPVENDGKL